jgi:hypothetical protein
MRAAIAVVAVARVWGKGPVPDVNVTPGGSAHRHPSRSVDETGTLYGSQIHRRTVR